MSHVVHYRLSDMGRKTTLTFNLSKKGKPRWQYKNIKSKSRQTGGKSTDIDRHV